MEIAKKSRPADVTIVLCGQAGQGIQTVETLLINSFKLAGCNVFSTKEYMSRVRGGMNSTFVRASDKPVTAYIDRIDILACLDAGASEHLRTRITPQTIVIGDRSGFGEAAQAARHQLDIPFTAIAEQAGGKVYSNSVAAGAIAGVLGMDAEPFRGLLQNLFAGKGEIIETNINAFTKGYEAAQAVRTGIDIQLPAGDPQAVSEHILVRGAQAVGLGAIGGGCNFVSSYPMSPSTGVLVFLAQNAAQFGIVAEQAEDEIAAVNMAIGAWYAGARALATTSGGGFALMCEGISLAGMLETPIVIHLAQRPGPATGLPTRTEQGDLELALYAGHGEFPRILLAPGTLEEGFLLAAKAFNLADKFQSPVIILTDQYYMDSYYNSPVFDADLLKPEKYIIETAADYRRYELTDDGISPRGVPGFGQGLVCVDSDEHDQSGRITEDLDLRVEMVDKRLAKLDAITQEAIRPTLYGEENYRNLVICWGATVNIVREAVELVKSHDTAILHFTQVYPLHPDSAELISNAENTIVVEGNATGQFAKLLLLQTGIMVDHSVLKYDGLNFAADTLADQLLTIISRRNNYEE